MKIWYQSASAYRFEPVWDEYGQTLETQCRKVANPGVEVYVTGIPVMVRDVENWRHLQYFQNVQTIQNMKIAQEKGFDAFVIGCTLDVGLFEGRAMLDIPVIGISESAYHLAMQLGRKFAVVTSSSAFPEVYAEQVTRYGVSSRYIDRPYIVQASEEEIAKSLMNPDDMIAKFKMQAQRAIDDGASVIIPAPAFLSALATRAQLSEFNGAIILDTVSIALKQAEMMVALAKTGVRPSRQIGVFCQPEARFEQVSMQRLSSVFQIDR
jgi:Asp/Glu/hydantoin racemase